MEKSWKIIVEKEWSPCVLLATRIIIIIIVRFVQCWMLPFLRACSRLDDSMLDDRQLPDQC